MSEKVVKIRAKVIKKTDKALLAEFVNGPWKTAPIWIPLSCVDDDSELFDVGEGVMSVAHWWADKYELVEARLTPKIRLSATAKEITGMFLAIAQGHAKIEAGSEVIEQVVCEICEHVIEIGDVIAEQRARCASELAAKYAKALQG